MSVLSILPELQAASILRRGPRRLFIGAYGFETRCLGWARIQPIQERPITDALVFKYIHPKGKNKIKELRNRLKLLGAKQPGDINFDYYSPWDIEDKIDKSFRSIKADEIVIDISSMAKVLVLASLCKLENFKGAVRIIYSEAENYCPKRATYEKVKNSIAIVAKFPSSGCEEVIRLRCLSSIRMQGQPIVLAAFTSFNVRLLSHMLGYMTPHRLLLINGRPPRGSYKWREEATQFIHDKYRLEYEADNPIDNDKLLKRRSSTLYYQDTVRVLQDIYSQYGLLERIVCAATGSKMQTVGLYFAKVLYPDIQIDYPTPDSYLVKDMTTGVRMVHELYLPNYSQFIQSLKVEKGAIRVAFSYSHKDENLRNDLETHLKLLERNGLITSWYDRKILPGEKWENVIDENFKRADIIIFLVSAEFIASDYCYEVEMKSALERHERGEAWVVPVIARDCQWKKSLFGHLQVLPKDGKPIKSWEDRDVVLKDIADQIEQVIEGRLRRIQK